jgi:iron(III) transport system ATP-binding protein
VTELALTGLHKRFGPQTVLCGLDLTVASGSFAALLGSSGAGKTTLLRLLAGFDAPDAGTIAIGGRIVDGPGVHVRPEQRRIGYVPQEGSLFPHLTVAANVAFGLPRAARRDGGAVDELLELVGLAELGRRYPHQLSGGQQQRVALARALAIKPDVVLLDEPFAALDANLREGVRDEVARILRAKGTTTLLVTHHQDEALSMADQVAVMRGGTIVQYATPQQLYAAPVDADLACFVGAGNLIAGRFEGGEVDTPLGRLPVRWHGAPGAAGCEVTVLVRPEQLALYRGGAGGGGGAGGAGGIAGRVVRSGYHGHDTVVHVALGEGGPDGATVLVRALGDASLQPGAAVSVVARGSVLVWPR